MELSRYIDHTLLSPIATSSNISKHCAEAQEYKFFAVCVNPVYVRQAVRELSASDVVVATVVGFPLGANLTDIKIAEAQRAISEGAEEIDMVMNLGSLKEGNKAGVISEIMSIVKVAKSGLVKVIIECDLLTKEEKITATEACIEAGAHMVKTCSGFVKNEVGATAEDIMLLRETIGQRSLKIKASGGIKDFETAKKLLDAGAHRIGTSSSVAIIKEAQKEAQVVNAAS